MSIEAANETIASFPAGINGWLTTAPNPRSRNTGWDAGQRGWRLHYVERTEVWPFGAHRGAALCGLRPAHGWSLDLFIDQPCERCAKRATERGIVIG